MVYLYTELTMTVFMYGDDIAVLYNDNVAVVNTYFPNVASKNISAASRLLAVKINNTMGISGVMFSLTYGGCITNTTSWRCTDTFYSNWNLINYDDSSWPLASSKFKNADIYLGPHAEFTVDCPFISIYNNSQLGDIYCRHWLN